MWNEPVKILLTGSEGQVGSALQQHLLAQSFNIISCTHAELDITDNAAIGRNIRKHTPNLIINAAAYTAVDKAEQEADLCMQVNHHGAENLAKACHHYSLPLIHLSTDYIFDGKKNSPYHEEDRANPVNVYGKSKWLGEQAIRAQCEQYLILRVSGIFSEYGNNFVKTILRLAKEKKELRIVADQITCPTSAHDIAGALLTLAHYPIQQATYHYASANAVSWHEFATYVIAEAKQHAHLCVDTIHPITTAEYLIAAKRPPYSVLDCSKIMQDYPITQPSWKERIRI